MRVRTGTSGFSYAAWKGKFYPEKLPARAMLAHYASRLATVEANATFYRMPTADALAAWRAQVPRGFVFALKAPRRITHVKRLRDCVALVAAFDRAAAALGPTLGPVLYQLPPTVKRDLPLLEAFLDALPPARRAAFEFRHASWHDDAVYAALSARGAALCVADTDEATTPGARTARFGYFRLRRARYTAARLRAWAAHITAQPWEEAFVYFKHEDEARGPAFALAMAELFSPGPAATRRTASLPAGSPQ
ncbi:MAG: DUF72 domain-containing protein [Anaeromyxobacteraceae bacterium]